METLIVTERLLACDASVARLSHWLVPFPAVQMFTMRHHQLALKGSSCPRGLLLWK